MLTTGNVLAKTLAKSQKVTFWSKKNSFRCFFFFSNCWKYSYSLYKILFLGKIHSKSLLFSHVSLRKCSLSSLVSRRLLHSLLHLFFLCYLLPLFYSPSLLHPSSSLCCFSLSSSLRSGLFRCLLVRKRNWV